MPLAVELDPQRLQSLTDPDATRMTSGELARRIGAGTATLEMRRVWKRRLGLPASAADLAPGNR